MDLSKGVYSKDDCGKLKSKYSNHTRRSKQNTYHVVNKNIASCKVTDILPWGALGIPKLRLFPLLVPKSIKSLPKNLKTSQHKTQQKIS